MTSNDPDFSQDNPPVPEPQDNSDGGFAAEVKGGEDTPETPGAEAWTSDQWTDATDSGNPDDIAPAADEPLSSNHGWSENGENSEAWKDLDETVSTPEVEVASAATARPRDSEAEGLTTAQQQAEKPAAAKNTYDDWGEADIPYQPKELGIIDQILLVLADGATVWRKGLRWVRSQLPPQWQRRLSDEVMTAIALGLLVLLLALWNPFGGGKATQPVAEAPTTSPAAQEPDQIPEATGPEADTPDLAPAPGISALPDPTPEQSLIADIQDKVSSISRSFAAGLVQSVEVNLPENRLIVNLGENWYGLLEEQQDDISQSIFEQVQQLDFKTLQLRDPDGVVVARNPVVGSNMVILHRSRSSEAELLIS
jgi:hypothetical protein